MKALIVALALLTSTAVSAQRELPKTVQLIDNTSKEVVGTVTYSSGVAFFRNKWGVHFATVVTKEDGTLVAYNPHGEAIALPNVPAFK